MALKHELINLIFFLIIKEMAKNREELLKGLQEAIDILATIKDEDMY